MKISFHLLTTVLFYVLFFYSCTNYKDEELVVDGLSTHDEQFCEPSEEIIDGILYVDGVSQEEVVVDFDLEGLHVEEGRLAFRDHDAMVNGLVKLSQFNTESVVAWGEKIGFTSLFSELIRIEEQPVERMEAAIDKGGLFYKRFFGINDEGELYLTKHLSVIARIFNNQGLIQVGDYVGTFYPGLNVWVHKDNTSHLIKALREEDIPKGDSMFYVLDTEAFGSTKNWIALETCPIDPTWLGPINQYKNPTANRRIDVQNAFYVIASINSSGLYDVDFQYWVESTSKKASWNKYNTNHYLSLDIRARFVDMSLGVFGQIRAIQGTQNVNNTKVASIYATISQHRNVPANLVAFRWEQVVETIPGSSGQTGTSASHQGMGGRYGRQQCD
ncbi:MAG: hypothetical protein R2795_16980 [Saprospiraceae bacterium]